MDWPCICSLALLQFRGRPFQEETVPTRSKHDFSHGTQGEYIQLLLHALNDTARLRLLQPPQAGQLLALDHVNLIGTPVIRMPLAILRLKTKVRATRIL